MGEKGSMADVFVYWIVFAGRCMERGSASCRFRRQYIRSGIHSIRQGILKYLLSHTAHKNHHVSRFASRSMKLGKQDRNKQWCHRQSFPNGSPHSCMDPHLLGLCFPPFSVLEPRPTSQREKARDDDGLIDLHLVDSTLLTDGAGPTESFHFGGVEFYEHRRGNGQRRVQNMSTTVQL